MPSQERINDGFHAGEEEEGFMLQATSETRIVDVLGQHPDNHRPNLRQWKSSRLPSKSCFWMACAVSLLLLVSLLLAGYFTMKGRGNYLNAPPATSLPITSTTIRAYTVTERASTYQTPRISFSTTPTHYDEEEEEEEENSDFTNIVQTTEKCDESQFHDYVRERLRCHGEATTAQKEAMSAARRQDKASFWRTECDFITALVKCNDDISPRCYKANETALLRNRILLDQFEKAPQ